MDYVYFIVDVFRERAFGGNRLAGSPDALRSRAQVYARMFPPALGADEDPATGSATAALAGTLARRYQGSDVEVTVDIRQGFAMGLTAELRKAVIAERRTNLMQLWAEGAPLAGALPAGELVATLAREAGLVSG